MLSDKTSTVPCKAAFSWKSQIQGNTPCQVGLTAGWSLWDVKMMSDTTPDSMNSDNVKGTKEAHCSTTL